MKFVRNVLTGNRNIVQRAETIKYGNGRISTECKAIDDIGTHLILNTAVALLPSDASGHTVINPDHWNCKNNLASTNKIIKIINLREPSFKGYQKLKKYNIY